jgi:hypothetical protein
MKKLFTSLLVIALLTSFAPKKDMTWAAIGDSITFHNGRVQYTKNRITKAYLDRVTDELPYIHSYNHGYGGWTAKAMADNINDWWAALPIGTFDDYQNSTGNSTVYGSYRTIVNKIKSLNSEAVIY